MITVNSKNGSDLMEKIQSTNFQNWKRVTLKKCSPFQVEFQEFILICKNFLFYFFLIQETNDNKFEAYIDPHNQFGVKEKFSQVYFCEKKMFPR